MIVITLLEQDNIVCIGEDLTNREQDSGVYRPRCTHHHTGRRVTSLLSLYFHPGSPQSGIIAKYETIKHRTNCHNRC